MHITIAIVFIVLTLQINNSPNLNTIKAAVSYFWLLRCRPVATRGVGVEVWSGDGRCLSLRTPQEEDTNTNNKC